MALQCGTSNDGCQGKAGKYRIEYTLPDPSYVRSRYAGESWREFKDATQNLRHELVTESTPAQPGQCPVKYRFFLRFKQRPSQSWQNLTLTMSGTSLIGPVRQMTLFLASGITGGDRESAPFLTPPPPDRLVEGQARSGRFFLRVWGKNDRTGIEQMTAIGFGNTGIFEIARAEYLGMERIDGQPDNCSPGGSTCTFRVLGANNAVIYTEKRTDCPEAITVPEVYGSNTGSFIISNSRQNVPLKIVNSEANNRKSTSVLLGNTVIKKLDSPLGSSLMPRVCWDCTEDEKCPENTCSVDCGDRTCCYNSQGISVKEIRK